MPEAIAAWIGKVDVFPMFSFLDEAVERCANRVQALGGTVHLRQKSGPATSAQIERVKARFPDGLPSDLLELGAFANAFEFAWSLDLREFGGVTQPSGRLAWDFSGLCPLDPRDFWWVEEITAEAGQHRWHQKVIIDCEANGDFLSCSIDPLMPHVPMHSPVDGIKPVELVLGTSLAEFYSSWARIGFLTLNEFCQWPDRTGLATFDVNYFREFEEALALHLRVPCFPRNSAG